MKAKILLLALLLVSVITPASAYTYFINGTTYRSDSGAVLGTVYLFNSTVGNNVSSAGGGYSLCCFENNTNGWNLTAQFNGSDSYVVNRTVIIVNDGNLSNIYLNLTVKKPAISSLASSSVTKTGATVSWTSNVSNVGNKLTYSTDSNFASNSFDTSWSNSTTTPSFALSNLRVATKYYYRASTGNIVNSGTTYTTTSDGSFTTGHGYSKDELPLESIAKAVVKTKSTPKPAIDRSAIAGEKGTGIPGKDVVLLVAFIVVAGIVVYVYQANIKGKPRRKK